MTITLRLGVVDLPYSVDAPRRVRVKTRKGGKPVASTAPAAGAQTTGDVAQWLEDKYGVMQAFFDSEENVIAKAVTDAMEDAFDFLVQTGKPPARLFPAEGLPDVQRAFNAFIDLKKMDYLNPGVPTKASLDGVNSRLKTRHGPVRPSFKDSGLFESTFRAWIDE
jgi:hypothetical protein